ncbi:MAG TPA: PLP-dependent aminotransferase family protein [Jatrophihabitans sp.]|jgi:DNA-binding transcriptional MocR family regulator|nr:PLP-dependent aminotransferase family protein [Jatrophihabitans sp.]
MATLSRIGGRALAELLPELRDMPGPVYTALAHAVTSLVLDGRIATETRLPSERELAAALRLSRATVTAAYDALRAEGFLASRTGSGSYVTVPAGSRIRPSIVRWSTRSSEGADVIDLSCAALPAPPDLLPGAVADAAGRLAPYLLGDGYEPAGLTVLREAVAARFTARGAATRADQILITNGSLHGLDLLLRLLVGPGERVITELPTYPGALDAIKASGGRVVPVPMSRHGGWHVDQMRAALRQTAARLAYVTPDFHNPTGALVPEHDRREVLKVARQTGTTVVIDESFVDLGFEGSERPTASIDPGVVTVGSLSKPVWGGLRIGWLRASTDLVHRLAALRTSIDMGGAVIDQVVAAGLFERIDAIAADRVAELRPQRDALAAALERALPQWRAMRPQGGLSLWAELPAPLSTPLTMLAAQAGVVVVPGSRFGVDGTLERFLRLPYALPADRLVEAVNRLAAVWAQLESTGATPRQLVVA